MTGNAEEPDANLVQAIDAGAFYFIQKPFERRVLLALVTRCLELRRLRDETRRYVCRLEEELEEARQFQLSLLPPDQTNLCGLSISARYVACRELAGDFYDYAQAGEKAAMLIADVVGHGTSAAMLTGIVKSAFHAAHVDAFDPISVIGRIKDGIRAFDPSRFITLCCARFDRRDGRLTYVNAGHPPPILRRRGADHVLLHSTGPLISSALADVDCEMADEQLREGDGVLFYTDGITEAQGQSGMFGQDRVVSLLTGNGFRGPQLLDEVLAAVSNFSAGRRAEDDMTLMAVEVPPGSLSETRGDVP